MTLLCQTNLYQFLINYYYYINLKRWKLAATWLIPEGIIEILEKTSVIDDNSGFFINSPSISFHFPQPSNKLLWNQEYRFLTNDKPYFSTNSVSFIDVSLENFHQSGFLQHN